MILTPIEKIFVYKNDIIVKRLPDYDDDRPPPGKRGQVTEFTFQSRRKLAFVAANTETEFKTMVTLTYPRSYPSNGKTVKGQLRAFLQYLRRVDCNVDYLWFLEFQRRGAPHFHLLLSTDLGQIEKTAVSERWYAIVASEDERHLRAGTRVEALRSREGGARYAVKYAMKMYQKNVPEDYADVGRFWGHSQGVKPKLKSVYRIRNEADLTLYLLKWLQEKNGRLSYKHLFGAAPYLRRSLGENDNNNDGVGGSS